VLISCKVLREQQASEIFAGSCALWPLSYRDLPLDAVGETSTDEADAPRFVARASTVFNAAQVDGAPEPPALPAIPIGPIPVFDRFVAATSAVIRTGALACYLPTHDEIRLPERAAFRSAARYCGTLTHELVHWTGAPHRLDRHVTTRFAPASTPQRNRWPNSAAPSSSPDLASPPSHTRTMPYT